MIILACIDGGLCIVAACGVAALGAAAIKKFKEREEQNDSSSD